MLAGLDIYDLGIPSILTYVHALSLAYLFEALQQYSPVSLSVILETISEELVKCGDILFFPFVQTMDGFG